MAFSDPLTIDIVGDDNNVLNKVKVGESSSVFQTDDGGYTFEVAHQYGSKNRIRSVSKLKVTSAYEDIYSGLTRPIDMTTSLVIDRPAIGVSISDVSNNAKALLAYLSLSSYAALSKQITGQI